MFRVYLCFICEGQCLVSLNQSDSSMCCDYDVFILAADLFGAPGSLFEDPAS